MLRTVLPRTIYLSTVLTRVATGAGNRTKLWRGKESGWDSDNFGDKDEAVDKEQYANALLDLFLLWPKMCELHTLGFM